MKSGDSPTTEELREALIAAVGVARDGKGENPPIDPPPRLKQFLAFKPDKFTTRALAQVREAVEADEEFRARVAAAVEEGRVNRVGWLWLARPAGWEQDAADLAQAAAQASEKAADAQSFQDLGQKLRRALSAQEKSERQREKASRERDEARLQASQARTEARRSEEESAGLAAHLEQAKRDLNAARKNQARLERSEIRSADKLKNAKARIDQLNKQLRDSRDQHSQEVVCLKERLAAAEDEVAMAREAGFEPPSAAQPVVEAELQPLAKRSPVPMPSGMLNDTLAAVEHLFRSVPEIVVLIDGYNVTFKNWSEMPVQQQRERFLQKLEELGARYSGAEFVVVFDGTKTDYDYIPTTPRSLGVSAQFSLPGVTADDHIIDMCAKYPLSRPLAVVSEDNDVRERARSCGANLVHPRKLLGIMGLEVEDPDGWAGFGVR